jgi:hypothetical protein
MAGDYFDHVKGLLLDLDLSIVEENRAETLLVISDEGRGINQMILDCEDQILVIEQMILELEQADAAVYRRLLQMNRSLVHGAFALDDSGRRLLFRDTLQLENLDLNELEASLQALSLGLAELGDELLGFVGKN